MFGMHMLVEALGIDPEKIQQEINAAAEFAKTQLIEIRQQLNRIEANQLVIYQAMVSKGIIEPVTESSNEVAGELTHEPRVN